MKPWPCPGPNDIHCCILKHKSKPKRMPMKKLSPCTRALTDILIFHTRINIFSAARDARIPRCFDWSSDDCSGAPNRPAGFDFIPSCRRHDFGYRNMNKQHRLTEDMRKRIDDNLRHDLYHECNKYHGWRGVECRRIADIYHKAVRKCGVGKCFGFGE